MAGAIVAGAVVAGAVVAGAAVAGAAVAGAIVAGAIVAGAIVAGAAVVAAAVVAAAVVAAVVARFTGFLTSTVTARVRPCENFWRTCVASAFAAAPVRVVDRLSGLVVLLCSFCSVMSAVVLGPLRPVNRCRSAGTHASAQLRQKFVQ